MTRLRTRLLVAAGLAAGLAGPAFAQGTGAPAGMESATAPGGTEGRAGARNEAEAIRSGDAIAVPPAEGIPVERVPPAPDAPMPPPALRQ
ncbi:hypothetical protein G3T14_11895 [Methylobacterium sp. BTF04]|uniref:hypothetical protein n=1 Tax=Methylobacterium sp. BTF04 TaxID=2708300 RepID=UPI0013D1EA41|nr:hypothetical protein [Methylobacterium sp. BTF04]NEU12834.1 hypothetical protein [Methylobacterium sp. BTF04]